MIEAHNKTTLLIYRPNPTYKGQEGEEKATFDGYLYAKIETEQKNGLITSTYSVVTEEQHGEPVFQDVYVGRRKKNLWHEPFSIHYYAIVETPEGVPIAKFSQPPP